MVHLRDFLVPEKLPAIPATFDWSKPAMPALKDIYENDQLGCCVVSAGYHIEGVATANANGTPFHASSSQIISDYSSIGGYVPGDSSTDQGCNLQDAFKFWMKTGFKNGTKLLGYVAINAADIVTLKTALYLFENLDFGVGLPDKWITPFPSGDGFVWDAATADPNNGHSFPGYGYDATSVLIDSWGLLGHLTLKGIAATANSTVGGEMYALLTPDMLAKGVAKAPNGLAWGDLLVAFNQMGGNVPVPAPAPVPPPAGHVTLAQAQAAIHNAFTSSGLLLSRSGADKIAEKALAGLPW
jgi:hypothetical protein